MRKLVHDTVYHIYNRGNNRENLFRAPEDYRTFLKLYTKHIFPVADTYAYCLLPNHFHLLLRIKSQVEAAAGVPAQPSQSFANLFNAYTRRMNPRYGRTGALFTRPFRRKPIADNRYFYNLIIYIHRNPQKHGFVADFRDWSHSSYQALLTEQPTRLARTAVLNWFDGADAFVMAHQTASDEAGLAEVMTEEG